MEWITAPITAGVSLTVGVVGAVLFMWRKVAELRAELAHKDLELLGRRHEVESKKQKDDFEFEKNRKAEVFRDLIEANKRQAAEIEDLGERVTAQENRIAILQTESAECHKKNMAQELELYKQSKLAEVQGGIIAVLEARVKTLEALHLPPTARGAALVEAVKDVAKEGAAEGAADGLG